MITSLDYMRSVFRIEEGYSDDILFSLVKYTEDNVIKEKFDDYNLWDADVEEETYPTQRGLVKEIVGDLVFSNLLSSGSFVVTGFGVVVKKEDYSINVFPGQTTPQYYSTKAFRVFEKLCTQEGIEKWSIQEDIMPFQIAIERLI